MDPQNRRLVWSLLLKHKTDRTVLITTHDMHEADFLSDRINIMAHGRLVTSGTSNFLKSRWGVGYHLTLTKRPNATRPTDDLLQAIRSAAPEVNVALIRDSGPEVELLLPRNAKAAFAALFRHLDENLGVLELEGYGISMTTMQEVFLKATAGEQPRQLSEADGPSAAADEATESATDEPASAAPPVIPTTVIPMPTDLPKPPRDVALLTGNALRWQQFKVKQKKKKKKRRRRRKGRRGRRRKKKEKKKLRRKKNKFKKKKKKKKKKGVSEEDDEHEDDDDTA